MNFHRDSEPWIQTDTEHRFPLLPLDWYFARGCDPYKPSQLSPWPASYYAQIKRLHLGEPNKVKPELQNHQTQLNIQPNTKAGIVHHGLKCIVKKAGFAIH